ncbi:hypothetical protein DE146DRAFT_637050 [Phaeosphaeria sp. MPI-PUGE-AT-0046c]|nr:hypothetical protein DE146DRAFT_637050 [Phaeosphaeria sp. MPI-PUGE-AT-0046c]
MATGSDSHRDRFASIRATVSSEVMRGMTLIEEVLSELESTETLLKKTRFDLEAECDQRRRLQQEVQELKALHELQGQRPFIVVLIDADADCYVFNDQLIAKGETGGEEAADGLLAVLQQFVRNLPVELNGANIMVKAFANLNGLSFALQRDKRVRDKDKLRAFAAGFSSRQKLFDFVDVGSGKERADFKVQENMKFYLESYQCRHLVLACGHDDGYAPWLGQYVGDKQVAQRITLVEGNPFPAKMKSLGLKTVQFNSIFNNIGSQTPWNAPSRAQAMTPSNNPEANSYRLGPVIIGDKGRRIDKRLHVEKATSDRIKKAWLCYYYYLRGQCTTPCQKSHMYRPLTPEEFDALWEQARQGRCSRSRKVDRKGGEDCSDALCVYGHGNYVDAQV